MNGWDLLALGLWGALLVKYWLTGQLAVLIHPNYFPLTVSAGLLLLGLTGWQGWQQWRERGRLRQLVPESGGLLPRPWSRFLLMSTAMVGLLVTPQPFNSQVAIARGDLLTLTRPMPQRFRLRQRPEDRSLVDWVRLLQVYPEPDAYQGQKARVEGFVVRPPGSPARQFLLARFVVTCCAADAYPVGLPVEVPSAGKTYPADTWLRVEGRMTTGHIQGQRRLVLRAETLTPIPRPANPYLY
ncbi:MAG: TIGR03943 family protein [Gloeomargarita sp. SKYBB_i_bin120]|nr:TIGR03943 family protein [Gloeomargarita sp. SKYG98]MCS7292000.1 TIGR03943 family protein [Gloeomargarita sp. SKYB120]MDW8177560.1 TIGR03943 family protein [Gloeomargarita sp. SKYBB_i_bin120]